VELNLRNVARVRLAFAAALTGIVGNVEHGVVQVRQIGTSSCTNKTEVKLAMCTAHGKREKFTRHNTKVERC
jgi:hypothetical protein